MIDLTWNRSYRMWGVYGVGTVVRAHDRGVLVLNPGRAVSELWQFRLPHVASVTRTRSHWFSKCVTCCGRHNCEINRLGLCQPRIDCLEFTYLKRKQIVRSTLRVALILPGGMCNPRNRPSKSYGIGQNRTLKLM